MVGRTGDAFPVFPAVATPLDKLTDKQTNNDENIT